MQDLNHELEAWYVDRNRTQKSVDWQFTTNDALLPLILNVCQELRTFCSLGNKVFDKTMLSRFKSTFADDIEDFFHAMVDLTEPFCQKLDKEASKALIIDTRDSKTAKADFFMSGIARLVIVYVAYKAGLLDKVRSVKSIAA